MTWTAGENITARRLNAEFAGYIIARGRRVTASTGTTATTSGTAQGVMRISGALTSGRLYRVSAPNLPCRSTTSGDRLAAQLTYTLDGTTPVVGSTRLTFGQLECVGTSVPNSLTVEGLYIPSSDLTFSVLLSIYRQSGAGTVSLLGASDWPVDLLIEDVGEDTSDVGVDL